MVRFYPYLIARSEVKSFGSFFIVSLRLAKELTLEEKRYGGALIAVEVIPCSRDA